VGENNMPLYNLHNYVHDISMKTTIQVFTLMMTSNLQLTEDDTRQGTPSIKIYQYLALLVFLHSSPTLHVYLNLIHFAQHITLSKIYTLALLVRQAQAGLCSALSLDSNLEDKRFCIE
jgi:hypothetical protein